MKSWACKCLKKNQKISCDDTVDLSQKLWGPDAGAQDVLSLFLNECCTNDMFCFDLFNDPAIALVGDLRDECQAVILAHLLNGKCTLAPTHLPCKLLACDTSSMVQLSHLLC